MINLREVHGLEEMKRAQPGTDQVTYDVIMPFIHIVAGLLDYTQGVMNSANKENFKAMYSGSMSQGTRCRQLAEYVIFNSPLDMLYDAPTNYSKEERRTKSIASIPTVWDETKTLYGKVGGYLAMAHQKGGVRYVGTLTNWDARTMELDLSFLGRGEYQAEVFKDEANADRVDKDYNYRITCISSDKKLKIQMAPGGGYAIGLWKR